MEEDVFTLSRGWVVDPLTLASEQMWSETGVELPEPIRRQLARTRPEPPAGPPPARAEQPRSVHRLLRVMAGRQGGRKLLSPTGQDVRPMMEAVRGAVFSMLQALAGRPASLPGGRWLDLYSGTGSVGIEALSRGCDSAHFVEMDPWVAANVLGPNLDACGFLPEAVVHTAKVETFLQRAEDSGAAHLGGAFDYVSVTPPYEAVTYGDLMAQLHRSPLVGSETCIIVEYPLRSKQEMPDVCGPLSKIRDRRYGRTHLAVYGPAWAVDD